MRLSIKSSLAALVMSAVLPLFNTGIAHAQSSPHGIAAVVNDDIVTVHDLRQRVFFMLATTGAKTDEATLRRLQSQALNNLSLIHI